MPHASATRSSGVPSPLTFLRGAAALLVVATGTYALTDTDIWGHLRFGLDMLASHQIPATDPYSFTTDQRWINHEWLSQVLFALAYRTGGLPLLAALRAANIALFVCILDRSLVDTRWPLRDIAIVLTVLASSTLTKSVRPQIFSLTLYATTLLALSRRPAQPAAPASNAALPKAWLPLVFVLWANLHAGWLLGLAAVGSWLITVPTRRASWLFVACAAATLVTPYGVALWWSLLETLGRGWADVSEWQPVTAWHLGFSHALVWLATAAVAAWAASRHRLRLFAAMWTIAVAIVAFRVRRHVPYFAITTTMLLVAQIAGARPAVAGNRWTLESAAAVTGAALVCAGIAWWLVRPSVTCLPPVRVPAVRPEPGAVRFIEAAGLRGRVVMWFDWGLYAIWHTGDRLRVSIDNRRETVYSDAVIAAHHAFYSGSDPAYPDRVGADYVWLRRDTAVLPRLRQRGWLTIHEGAESIMLSRRPVPPVSAAPWNGDSPPCFPAP